MANKIYIFDTTLRDGEQAPGMHLNVKEKLEIALQLQKLNVDTIEAGFPISSKSDFEAVKEISKAIKDRSIAALARANFKDIDAAGEALKDAANPVIHTFISSSDIHLKYQLNKTREEVLQLAAEAVKRCKKYTDNIEFSAMDATRSDKEYLAKMYEIAIQNGATVLNVPDTVGYALPLEYSNLIEYLLNNVRGIENVIISVHCHNDLGLAVANSILAATKGARQIECSVNGIGERAGNAAIEEVALIIDTRKKDLDLYTDINIKEIARTSNLVASMTGYLIAPNKAIVGKNAFSHEAGIHQDGMLKDRSTYEILKAEDIGLSSSKLILGKHSGRHAFIKRLEDLGFSLSDEELEKAFERFKSLAEKKGAINDNDLKAIVQNEVREIKEYFKLNYYHILSGTNIKSTSTVGIEINGKLFEAVHFGDGPVDASFKAIDQITKIKTKLIDYSIEAVSEGKDAIGAVKIVVSNNGIEVLGRGISTDIIEASIKAYINAMNKIIEKQQLEINN
ncbi:MAG: 2-isopropylmalate synthase [Actinobacteria bacterium]|nr:2-isopropylmalate synthase [Actinomycetota bacterium]